MPEWIIAMFLIGALLSAGDMAKIFLEARRSNSWGGKLRAELAGMDFLVFRTDRRSLHDAAHDRISD